MPAYGKRGRLFASHQPNAILIRYVAGYGDASRCRSRSKSWMLLKIGTMHKMRGDVVAGQISTLPHTDALLDGYRFMEFA